MRRVAGLFARLAARLIVGSALLLSAKTAAAEPTRILVAAGSKLGLPAERPLRFASNDATRVRDVMVSLGGVKPENAHLLSEPTREQLFAAIDRAKAEALRHRSEEVALVFYFSGHGDRDALHLGTDRVTVSELSRRLAEVPASLRIAVTDACRATRDKGFAADEPFAISATMIPQASGQVWLHASSDGEAAQESDELQGALFTHAWLNGLRGAADANGDARVTLDESFAFAHSQTLIRSAKSSGVLQKPEAVVSLREGAPVVMTETSARLATLSLPQSRDAHFLVYSAGAKSVLSELWGSPERRLRIRLPPGRYVVHRRAGTMGGLATIAVGAGEERTIDDRDFASRPLEMLAQKGGAADADTSPTESTPRRPHELLVGWDVGANTRMGLVQGPRVGYAYAWRHVALTVGGGADYASRSLENKSEELVSGYGRGGIELRLPLGTTAMLRGGAYGRAGMTAQTITGTNAAAAPSEVVQSAFAFGPEALLALRVALGEAFFADLGALGSVVFLREEGTIRGIPGAQAALALGARF
jgi:hypothetical protein